MTMIFKNVDKKVPIGPGTGGEPEMKQILFGVSGVIKPKEVVALMVCTCAIVHCEHRNDNPWSIRRVHPAAARRHSSTSWEVEHSQVSLVTF